MRPNRLLASLHESIGDITFGMEDGAVSIAGLVFGVAASTDHAAIVLLAGAAGASAGAVSMMAGTYLDVHSERSRATAQLGRLRSEVERDPDRALRRLRARLAVAGFSDAEADAVAEPFGRHPDALAEHLAAVEYGVTDDLGASPWTHAGWMFIADIFAAGVPVVPFALFDIATARIVSLLVTGALMALLGIARALIGREPIIRTAIQTMAIAGAAAIAGVLIGRLVSA